MPLSLAGFFASKRVSLADRFVRKTGRRYARGAPPPSSQTPPESQPSRGNDDEVWHRVKKAKTPKNLSRPEEQSKGDYRGAQMRWRSREVRKQPHPERRSSKSGEARKPGQLKHAKEIATQVQHLTTAEQAGYLLELGDAQELREGDVDDASERQAGAQRDDLAEQAAAEGAVEDVPDAE